MKVHAPSAPLPPFWAAVRRRDADIDLVVLPADLAERGGEVDARTVARAVERVTDAARSLGGEEAPRAEVAYGPDPGTVVARVRVAGHRADGLAALSRLRERLADDGWSLRRQDGGVARLLGRRDGLRLVASYAGPTGAFLLQLSTDPLPVGQVRARELVSC